MYTFLKPFYRNLFLSLLCLFVLFGCGLDETPPADRSDGMGSLALRLIFPPDTPRSSSSVKNAIEGGIDCADLGIATLNCTLFSADNTLITKIGWPCSLHEGVVDNIPPASGITVKVTAEDNSGTVKLQGEDNNVTIYAGQQTESKEIEMVPPPTDSFSIHELNMTFVRISAGTFRMGSPEAEVGREDDESQHEVTLTQDFYMQTTEVTQGQWLAVMGENPSYFQNCGENCPVEQVSWNDIQEFITRLNNQITNGYEYRLPTEAQWEYAARAGSETAFCNGDITIPEGNDPILNTLGWYRENSDAGYAGCYEYEGRCRGPQPVGGKNPNAWGLFDMHGNVWEWCQDWYGDYPSGSVIDPQGPSSGDDRVLRGGSWHFIPRSCRSARRNRSIPAYRYSHFGFRLVAPLVSR
jgi:formylglycine-generating enzyme required for sulfatase activity